MSRPRPRRCPGPFPEEGVQAQAQRGVQAQAQGDGVSQYALRQTRPQQTATAADGRHPTGMHSCYCPQTKFGAR